MLISGVIIQLYLCPTCYFWNKLRSKEKQEKKWQLPCDLVSMSQSSPSHHLLTHPQITCAVSRMRGYVVSPKTEATTLIGRGRITWRRTPSGRPIRALKLTAVEPKRVGQLSVPGFLPLLDSSAPTLFFRNKNGSQLLLVFRVLHVHRGIAAASSGRQGSSALAALQCDLGQGSQGLRQSPVLCLLLLPHEGQTHWWVVQLRITQFQSRWHNIGLPLILVLFDPGARRPSMMYKGLQVVDGWVCCTRVLFVPPCLSCSLCSLVNAWRWLKGAVGVIYDSGRTQSVIQGKLFIIIFSFTQKENIHLVADAHLHAYSDVTL